MDAIHAPFDYGMMLREVKLGVGLEVTLETGGGIFAGIDNELAAPAAGFDVVAAGPVAGFTAGLAGHFGIRHIDPCMGAGREPARNIGVAIVAGFVANVSGARNFRRRHHGASDGRTRTEQGQGSPGQGHAYCAD